MKYILDSSGYVESASCNPISCDDKVSQEYTGSIPSGYDSLDDWILNANIRAYKITNNNLVYDSARDAALQAEWAKTGNPQEYSTEEKIIGKWIDGRNIYRKVLNIGTPSATHTYQTHGITNFNEIISAKGRFLRPNAGVQNLIPATYTNWEVWAYDFTNKDFALRFSTNQWNAGVSNLQIVLEYTKTTD